MTETQAKSGAARAGTEPAQGSATAEQGASEQGVNEAPPPAASDADATQSGPVIRRGPTAVQAPAAGGGGQEAKPAEESAPARTSGTAVPESSPTTRLSPAEASARAEEAARTAPGARPACPQTCAPSRPASAPARPAGGAATTGRATVPVSGGTATRARGGTESPTRSAAGAVTAAAAVGAARVSETLRTARATVAGAASRGPRRARLHLKRIDPWSVMKFSFAVSMVLFFVVIVATSVLYLALDAMGVFDSINRAVSEISGGSTSEATGFSINAKGVIGTSILLGAVNTVLFTALATLGAFVYNVCADLVGGVELTLSEKE